MGVWRGEVWVASARERGSGGNERGSGGNERGSGGNERGSWEMRKRAALS